MSPFVSAIILYHQKTAVNGCLNKNKRRNYGSDKMMVDTKKCLPSFLCKNKEKELKSMGRPKGGRNTAHSKEEKLSLVKRNLAGEQASELERETGIYHSQIHKWTKQYLEGGEAALVNKRKQGNPLVKYTRKKELTPTEQLEYKIALLERELLKKDGEIVRLKKSVEQEGGDAKRK